MFAKRVQAYHFYNLMRERLSVSSLILSFSYPTMWKLVCLQVLLSLTTITLHTVARREIGRIGRRSYMCLN